MTISEKHVMTAPALLLALVAVKESPHSTPNTIYSYVNSTGTIRARGSRSV